MKREWPGPALIKNVTIEGFQYGINIEKYIYSMTFERIRLVNQTVAGIRNSQNVLAIRGLDIQAGPGVTAVLNDASNGMIALLDATISGSGSAAAIVNKGKLFLRDVTVTGYTTAVDNQSGPGADIPGGSPAVITEYVSHEVESVFPSPSASLRLPVAETPTFHTTDFTQWASVTDFGATPDNPGDDDGPAIQAAIDSGKPLIFLPNGAYHVSAPIILRGDMRKFMGCQSALHKRTGFSGEALIRHDGGSAPAIILEHLWIDGLVLHNGLTPLALRHLDLKEGYANTAAGAGDLFLEDVLGKPYHIDYPQRVWGRQVNGEFGSLPILRNRGGTVWLLGFKTEGELTLLENNAGQVELFGGFLYPFTSHNTPALINTHGRMSANYAVNYARYDVQVQDTRNGETRDLLHASVPSRGAGSLVPLYVGYPAAGANLRPTAITLSSAQVNEKLPPGTPIGALSTVDPDPGDTFTYTLSGADAASFSIAGAQLRTAAVFDYNTKSTYHITVRSTDAVRQYFEQDFTIQIAYVPEVVSLAPAADAQVREGGFANANFGSTDRMEVKLTSSVRQGYMKFDLSGVNGSSVTNATLTLVVSNVEAGVTASAPIGVALHSVATDTWTETGLTWNTKPALGVQLGTANISAAGQVVTFDITTAVNAKLAGDRVLSLAIIGASGTRFIAFWTKEGTTAPMLALTLPRTGTPYEQWRDGIDWGTIPVDQRDPNYDPDHDGQSNFLERALGGNPTRPDTAPGYNIAISPWGDGSQLMTLWYLKGAPDLSYQFVWSNDLATWSSAGVSTEQYSSERGLHFRTAILPLATPRAFGRLHINEP